MMTEYEKLAENERLDEVNDDLKLIQNVNGLTFGTDALLLASFVASFSPVCRRALEIGSGSGIVSLLLLSRERAKNVTCVEVQKAYAELTRRNAALNGFDDRLTAICKDVRDLSLSDLEDGREFDLVFTNPPYMKSAAGKACEREEKEIARHEVFGTIDELVASAGTLLRYGGDFAAVYRPDRLCDLISAMKAAKIEPKRMTFVAADDKTEPSSVLVLGKRGGRSGLLVTPPLFLYKSAKCRENSDDLNAILECGRFPAGFFKKGTKT